MSMSALDIIKITQYLNNNRIEELNYKDLRNALANNRCGNKDICEYFLNLIEENLKEEKVNTELISKMLFIVDCLIKENNSKVDQNIVTRFMSLSGEYKNLLAREEKSKEDLPSNLEIQSQRENIIREVILNKIYNKGYNFGSLYKELQNEGYNISNTELYNILTKINERFSIIDEAYYPPRYKLMQPEVKTNKSLIINTFNNDSYDIFLTSDFHIHSLENELKQYNAMYDYCANNGIGLILNLGDFIDGISYTEDKCTKRDYYNRIAEQIIERFPASPGIHQIILGGNHDRNSLFLGLDTLKIISKAREDLFHIGYDNARIYFESDNHPLILHHFKEKIVDNESLVQKIGEYHSQNEVSSYNTYLNLVGHLHKSRYNYSDNYCVIPSLTCDRYQNGAWHLKIYFNEDRTIKYFILIPLILLDNRLLPTNEIVHERKLIK